MALVTIAAVAALAATAEAVVPDAQLDLGGGSHVFAASAAFGAALPASSSRLKLTLVRPLDLQDGCSPKVNLNGVSGGWALLTQRSPNCSFEDRAVAAQGLGASLLVVANSVEGVYRNRTHADAKDDYECSRGSGYVVTKASDGGKLAGYPQSSCAAAAGCDSGRCLLTGGSDARRGLKVCCAWDTYMTMAAAEPDKVGLLPCPCGIHFFSMISTAWCCDVRL